MVIVESKTKYANLWDDVGENSRDKTKKSWNEQTCQEKLVKGSTHMCSDPTPNSQNNNIGWCPFT